MIAVRKLGRLPKLDIARVRRLTEEVREGKEVLVGILKRSKGEFLGSVELRYAARYAIIEVVEAAALAGSHVLEAKFNLAPESYSELFALLATKGVLSADVGEAFRKLVGLRNLIVHRYWEVDDSRVYDEAKGSSIETIEKFVEEIERYVKGRAR